MALSYDGATPEQLRHPLVRELLAVHQIFRNELAIILRHVNELLAGEQPLPGPDTTGRVQVLVRAGSQYSRMLHMHHHLETSALFPPLQQAGLDKSVIDRLNAEHDEISLLIDNFSAAVHHLSTIEPDVMDSDLRRLADALHAHLAYEETHVCPFLTRFSGWPLSNTID